MEAGDMEFIQGSSTISRKDGTDAKKARAVEEAGKQWTVLEKEGWKKEQEGRIAGHDHGVDAVEAWDKESMQGSSATNADPAAVRVGNKGRLPGFMVLRMRFESTCSFIRMLNNGN